MPAGKRRKAAQLFVAVFVFWVGTTGAERLISAQKSRTTRTSEGVERTYADSVRATFGSIQIDADSAIVRSDGDDYLFVRGVRLRDGERSIRADALTYVAADSVARFRGRVRITDTGRAIRASRVEYDLGRQVLRAEGDVRVRLEDGIDLSAEQWFHDTRVDTGLLLQNVEVGHVVGEDTVRVTARRARLSSRTDTVAFTGASRLYMGVYSGSCDTLVYTPGEGEALLCGSPSLEWSVAQTGVDPIADLPEERHVVRADRILMLWKGGAPVQLTLNEDALLEVRRTGSDTTRHFQLRAEHADVIFESGEIAKVNAEGACTIAFRSGSGDSTSMESRGSALVFDAGLLARIDLVAGILLHRVKEAVHRVEGERLVLSFEAEQIRSVNADSLARYRTLDEGTHLASDQIELIFTNGELVSARATGGVSGEVEEAR